MASSAATLPETSIPKVSEERLKEQGKRSWEPFASRAHKKVVLKS